MLGGLLLLHIFLLLVILPILLVLKWIELNKSEISSASNIETNFAVLILEEIVDYCMFLMEKFYIIHKVHKQWEFYLDYIKVVRMKQYYICIWCRKGECTQFRFKIDDHYLSFH